MESFCLRVGDKECFVRKKIVNMKILVIGSVRIERALLRKITQAALRLTLLLFLVFFFAEINNKLFADVKEPVKEAPYKEVGYLVNAADEKVIAYYAEHPEYCYEVTNTPFNQALPGVSLYFFISPKVTGEQRAAFAKWKNKFYSMPAQINKLLVDYGLKINRENQIAIAKAFIIAENVDRHVDKVEFGEISEQEGYPRECAGGNVKCSVRIAAHAFVSLEKGCLAEIPAHEIDLYYAFNFVNGQFYNICGTQFEKGRFPVGITYHPRLFPEEEVKQK